MDLNKTLKSKTELVAIGHCPICDIKIDKKSFRDSLSRKEFKISGLCQKCQDAIFSFE